MSVIAIRWAYSRPISNPVAKNVLVFLSTHDFSGNRSFFRVQTICDAISFRKRAVIDALGWLQEQGYIRKDERYGEAGQQLTNQYVLLIDDEYVQEFTKSYELSTTPPAPDAHPPAPDAHPPLHEAHTYKNNAFKNNIKKSSCASPKKSTEQKPKAQEQVPEGHFLGGLGLSQRQQNEKRHDFAGGMTRQAEARSTVPDFGPGHPTWESQQSWKRQWEEERKKNKQLKETSHGTGAGTDGERFICGVSEKMLLAEFGMA